MTRGPMMLNDAHKYHVRALVAAWWATKWRAEYRMANARAEKQFCESAMNEALDQADAQSLYALAAERDAKASVFPGVRP